MILIIDDEEIVRNLCRRTLTWAGYTVLQATNGLQGWSEFQTHCDSIDVVLCDVSMPEMDGVTVASNILSLKPTARVILMTGYDPDFAVSGQLRARCGVIGKPFTPDNLTRYVQAMTGKLIDEMIPVARD